MEKNIRRELDDRKQIELLIRTFYEKVRADELIGYIFNKLISDWESHIQLLTDFWETNLLFVSKYKGNPPKEHIKVDQATNYNIEQKHFDRWLLLWNKTIDENFEGKLAEMAKYRARNIASALLFKMMGTRA